MIHERSSLIAEMEKVLVAWIDGVSPVSPKPRPAQSEALILWTLLKAERGEEAAGGGSDAGRAGPRGIGRQAASVTSEVQVRRQIIPKMERR